MATQVRTLPSRKPKFREARPHDYLYDTTYVLSCPRDLQRCEAQALMNQPNMELHPNFRSMFSDHPRYPRLRMCLRCPDQSPNIDPSWDAKQKAAQPQRRDVSGVDRHMFFRRPVAPNLPAGVPPIRLVSPPSAFRDGVCSMPPLSGRSVCLQSPSTTRRHGPCSPRNKGTQTDYRESETQTVPWECPFTLGPDQQPEVLTLAALAWGNGLPAGWLEVDLIERMRVRRAWEEKMKPPETEADEEKWRRAFARLDRDQWLLRDREIEANHRERMRLAKLLLEEERLHADRRLEGRLARAWARGERQRDKKIGKIRMQRDRELRKLSQRHQGAPRRYKRLPPIEEHADFTSQLYGPLARYGADPAQRHEIIDVPCTALQRLEGLDILERMPPAREPAFDYRRQALPRKDYILCERETRWTEEALYQLLAEMKGLRGERESSGLGLVRRLYQESSPPSTPSQEGVSDKDEEVYQASVFLQKIIKGRAVQCLMHQGLRRCRELIMELRSTHGLDARTRKLVQEQRTYILDLQEQEQLAKNEEGRLMGLVKEIMGGTLGGLFDFLNKELERLQDERIAHAFAMLAERSRQDREAAEAGRRQAEERRRREHDEMFRQVVKVHQEAVDTYLEDVILKTLDRTADDEARRYVQYMVQRIDEAADEASRRRDTIEREELVAELLHSFLLPEVEKQRLRERHLAKQHNLLRAAHDEIFGRLLHPRPHGAEEPPVPEPPYLEYFPDAKKWYEPCPDQASVTERLAGIPPDPTCWQGPDSSSDQFAKKKEEEKDEIGGEGGEEEEEEQEEEFTGEGGEDEPHTVKSIKRTKPKSVQIMHPPSESDEEEEEEDEEKTETSGRGRGGRISSEFTGEGESSDEKELTPEELMNRLIKELANVEAPQPSSKSDADDEKEDEEQ